MTERNWDKELAKIDKQLSSIPDDQLLQKTAAPAGAAAPGRGGQAAVPAAVGAPSKWGVVFRVGLAVALATGVPFWPYASRCGVGLVGYLATISVILAAGTWAAVSTWRARSGRAHLLALTVIAWGITLAAVEILPRIGYARDAARVAWMCG